MIHFIAVFLLEKIVRGVLAYLFKWVFSFFEWISDGIALRLMKWKIPREDLQPLEPPESDEDVSRVMKSPQIVFLASWIRLRNKVHLTLSRVLFLVLIPGLILYYVEGTLPVRLAGAGSVLLFGALLVGIAKGIIRSENETVEQMEAWPDQMFAENERLEKSKGLVETWNRQVRRIEKGDRGRGVFLAGLGTALAGLLIMLFLRENVLTREVSPGVYEFRGLQYRLMEDGTAEITGHGRIGRRVTVPERFGNVPVTVIGEKAFSDCEDLGKVNLPAEIREIRERAFSGCDNLAEIQLHSGLQVIGDMAFQSCFDLERIWLPQGLKRIGAYAFSGTRIRQFDLPEGLESLGTGALNSYETERVTIPDSLRTIEGNPIYDIGWRTPEIVISADHPAFKVEDHLLLSRDGTLLVAGLDVGESCTVPQGVQVIAGYAFRDNDDLQAVTLPDSLQEMGERAFELSESLETVTFGDGLTVLPELAFRGCTSLRECALPGTLREIGSNAFMECSQLSSISLPQSLERIGDSAFRGCTALVDCALPAGLREIGSSAFSGCGSLSPVTFPQSLETIGAFAFENCRSLDSISLPQRLERIEFGAFKNCTGLREIDIPEHLKELGWTAFDGCTSLQRIRLPRNMPENMAEYTYYNPFLNSARGKGLVFEAYPGSWAIRFLDAYKLRYELLEDTAPGTDTGTDADTDTGTVTDTDTNTDMDTDADTGTVSDTDTDTDTDKEGLISLRFAPLACAA